MGCENKAQGNLVDWVGAGVIMKYIQQYTPPNLGMRAVHTGSPLTGPWYGERDNESLVGSNIPNLAFYTIEVFWSMGLIWQQWFCSFAG